MSRRETHWDAQMRAAMAGDAVAYDQLLRELALALRPFVRRGLSRAARSQAEADDVVQEILLAVHLKRHTWDQSQPIGPWIRAIARHKLIDALRRRGGHYDLPVEEFAESLPAEDTAPSLSQQDVDRHLERLPSGQRAVVRAIAVDGASIADTAGRLQMTEGAVRVALHRGLTGLERLLA